jgi:hypothetical protein
LDHSFGLREGKGVRFVGEELESGRLVALIDDIKQSVGRSFQLYLTEVDGLA